MKTWYQIRNNASNTEVEILVHDYIGRYVDVDGNPIGVSSKTFIEELGRLAPTVGTIRVSINSPGGDVFDAIAIANALRDQRQRKNRTVETIVDGLAASAASLVLMGGQTVTMAANSLLMIHLPHAHAWGTADELRGLADALDKVVDNSMVPTYQWHSEQSAATIKALLTAETWMDADEAVAAGFATRKAGASSAALNLHTPGAKALHVPDRYRHRVSQRAAAPAPTHGWDRVRFAPGHVISV